MQILIVCEEECQGECQNYLDTYRNRQTPSRVTLVTEGRVTDAESEGLELYIETGPGQSGDLRVSGCPDSGLQSSYNLTHRYTLELYVQSPADSIYRILGLTSPPPRCPG